MELKRARPYVNTLPWDLDKHYVALVMLRDFMLSCEKYWDLWSLSVACKSLHEWIGMPTWPARPDNVKYNKIMAALSSRGSRGNTWHCCACGVGPKGGASLSLLTVHPLGPVACVSCLRTVPDLVCVSKTDALSVYRVRQADLDKLPYDTYVNRWGHDCRKYLLTSVKALGTRPKRKTAVVRRTRKWCLQKEMEKLGLEIRTDSSLCKGFIANTLDSEDNWTAVRVARRMAEMKMLFEYWDGGLLKAEELCKTAMGDAELALHLAERRALAAHGGKYPDRWPWLTYRR